jgi:hypothetical protein
MHHIQAHRHASLATCVSLGIATALRGHAPGVAKAAGCRSVRSATGHLAMARINGRFGFMETYCEVRLVRRLIE